MEQQNIKSSDTSSSSGIITLVERVGAILVLCIIVVEWLVTLNSLWTQRMGP